MDPGKDKSSKQGVHSPKAAHVIRGRMVEFGLLDTLRDRNIDRLEGTHTSTAHGSWLRLDYWLLSRGVNTWVTDIGRLPRTLSDNNPVKLTLHIP